MFPLISFLIIISVFAECHTRIFLNTIQLCPYVSFCICYAMVRSIPAGNSPTTSGALSYVFFAGWIAATIAIVAGMCGVRFPWRRSQPPSGDGSSRKTTAEETSSVPQAANTEAPPPLEEGAGSDSDEATKPNPETVTQELPLPPRMRALNESQSFKNLSRSTTSTSTMKLKTSLSLKVRSMKMPSMSMMKREDGKDLLSKTGKPFKREDSIWTKAIILGEKCQVPTEDEEEIIYDKKGNRILTYHRKNPRPSIPISRSNSSSSSKDPQDAVPNS
ncbi:hypothetical protein SAY86_011233 [Trapa natans]|uniref:Uncharacterized protein n=1 Tax=Trapa natans TaxID=22666 RepID=A0AAN7R414_TRANT|nr:hypothetical protein SAY86_011233 [Trapa natans]